MSNVFIASILMIISTNFFFISYQLNGINKAVIGTPLSIFELSIPLVEDSIYFDKDILYTNLTSYYDDCLYKYVDNYSLQLQYYHSYLNSICVTNYCDSVVVNIKAEITLHYEYVRSMRFEIRHNV